MKKVFVGGSRRISRLNDMLRKRLDQIVGKNLQVLLGDANGADKAVQAYLDERGYRNVQVFCSAGDCRNNLGSWEVKSIKPHTVEEISNSLPRKTRLWLKKLMSVLCFGMVRVQVPL